MPITRIAAAVGLYLILMVEPKAWTQAEASLRPSLSEDAGESIGTVVALEERLAFLEAELLACKGELSDVNQDWGQRVEDLHATNAELNAQLQLCLKDDGSPYASLIGTPEFESLSSSSQRDLYHLLLAVPIYLTPDEVSKTAKLLPAWKAEGRDVEVSLVVDVVGIDRLVAELREFEWRVLWAEQGDEFMAEMLLDGHPELYAKQLAEYGGK